MNDYTPKQLAQMAGISVRTLHYYDEIGLLEPHKRSKANHYRHYSHYEALRLQQILFYRELDYSLEDIKAILNNPHFDFQKSLKFHQKALKNKIKQFQTMLKSIDQTLDQLTNNNMTNDEQLYAGFNSVEEGKALTQEAQARWGDEVKASQKRIQKMGPQKWKQVQEEGHAITQKIADLMAQYKPGSPEVQKTIGFFHRHLENFYPVSKERLLGLGQLYVTDERFRVHYDKYKKGLADFLNQAIHIYGETL